MADRTNFPVVPGVEIREIIGRGGFATVYSGYQPAFRREVAVKVLQRSELDADARSRFDRECQVMGALSNHPYIVTLYDAGYTENERPYMVMPYVSAGTLDDRIRSEGALPWEEVTRTGIHLAGALETAHRAGVLHRDIKPANVLRSEYGDLLGDFGIARIAGGHETQSGVITASIAHAPPEVLEGEAPSPRADVYSLGSTLFEALAGRAAFSQTSDSVGFASMMRRILLDPPPALSVDSVPRPVAEVVERALAKDKADRHVSAREFGEHLRDAQRALSVPPTDLLIYGASSTSTDEPATVDDGDDGTIVVGSATAPPPAPGPPATFVRPRIPPPAPPGVPDRPAVPDGTGRRRTGLVAASIAGVILVIVGAIVLATRGGDDPSISSLEPSDDSVTRTEVSTPSSDAAEAPVTPVTTATSSDPATTPASTSETSTTLPIIEPLVPVALTLPPGDPVEIQFLNPNIQTDVLNDLIADFENANPDITVDVVEEGSYHLALQALVNGDVQPDVALLNDRSVQTVLDQVDFVPVRDFIAEDDFDESLLLPNAADLYSSVDGLEAMPYNVAVPMLYANGDLLAEEGIDLDPGAELTTTGILDRCVLLADAVTTCIEFGLSAFMFTELITNSGGRVFDTDGFSGSAGAAAFDTPVGRSSFEFLVGPVLDGTARAQSGESLFASGEAAFYMNTSSILGSIDRTVEELGEGIDVVPLGIPHLDGVEPTGVIPGGGALWVLDRGDERRGIASWLLVDHLSSLSQMIDLHAASGYVPGREDAEVDAAFTEFWSTDPAFRGAYDELVDASTQALPNDRDGRAGPFSEIDDAIGARITEARTGESTIDVAFEALVDDVNALLADYSSENG